MELDLSQFFRDLLIKYHVVPCGIKYAAVEPLSDSEFEKLVDALTEHARDFRNMP